MLKSVLPDDIDVNITIHHMEVKSNLTKKETTGFTEKKIFYTILGFTQSNSRPLGVVEGFFQPIPGPHKSDKHINIIGMDKVRLKCDCITNSTVNGIWEPILCSVALDKPPGHEIYKEPRFKHFERKSKSV